jgi:hypothetical protein
VPRSVARALYFALTLLLLAAFLVRLSTRGGPYFERPVTVMDHVGPGKHETRDALVILPKVRPLLPRGATVVCVRPVKGVVDATDMGDYLTAIGQLPQQKVVPPFFAMLTVPVESLPDYVVAVGEPFDHPRYRLLRELLPEGRLYQVQR